MNILSVNSTNQNAPVRRMTSRRSNQGALYNLVRADVSQQSINFKGDGGALRGMAKGAAVGGAIAGAAILSGVAAPLVATGGALALLLGTAGFGAQIGGIVGGIKEALEEMKNK